jgi:hypothetical protein
MGQFTFDASSYQKFETQNLSFFLYPIDPFEGEIF